MSVRQLSGLPRLELMYARAMTLGLVGRGDKLPDLELELPSTPIDYHRLEAYRRVCEFRRHDVVPPTYPHVLAFPLGLRLMTDRSFPVPIVGLVHVANRITQYQPIDPSERLALRTRGEDLRPHERGSLFNLVTEARVNGEIVWSSVSTYLSRGSDSGATGEDRGEEGNEREDDRPGSDDRHAPESIHAIWRVRSEISPHYAAVSGDRNPHHLHPLLARAFGFPRLLAHGMWMKARCLAAFEHRLPDSFTAAVSFERPLLLPATVTLTCGRAGRAWTFALRDPERAKPHLTGRIRAEGEAHGGSP